MLQKSVIIKNGNSNVMEKQLITSLESMAPPYASMNQSKLEGFRLQQATNMFQKIMFVGGRGKLLELSLHLLKDQEA